jgi:hypothetical protein
VDLVVIEPTTPRQSRGALRLASSMFLSIPESNNVELVDLVGIEPTTSSMPWKRAPSCATGPLSENPILQNRQKGRTHSRPHYSDSQRTRFFHLFPQAFSV